MGHRRSRLGEPLGYFAEEAESCTEACSDWLTFAQAKSLQISSLNSPDCRALSSSYSMRLMTVDRPV
jgi:hypothetical protein